MRRHDEHARARVLPRDICSLVRKLEFWNENELFAIKRAAALSAPLVWDTTARVPSK